MTEPAILRVFVDGNAISVAPGATVGDAIRTFDATAADAVAAGSRAVTDSRGLPIALDAALSGGAVLRVVSSRVLRDTGEPA